MGGGYKIRDRSAIYFLTLQVIEWVDLFTRQIYLDIVLENLRYYQKDQGLLLNAYVIMSNHIHLVASATQPKNDLSSIIGRLKTMTAKQFFVTIDTKEESRRKWMLPIFSEAAAKHQRNKKYQIWTHDNHPVELNSNEMIFQRINYIHENPVRAGLVETPEEYIYSSAKSYAGMPGLLKLDLLFDNMPG